MGDCNQADVYLQAGFGRPVMPGKAPAIVVVDFTYGFTDPQYPTATDMTTEIAQTRILTEAARVRSIPVIFTSIAYTPAEIVTVPWLRKASGMAALLHGTRLVEIDERAGRASKDPLIYKSGASAFFGTHLSTLLMGAGVDTLVVAGATTSGCVRATVVDAVQSGFNVLVPRDCVADRAKEPHDASLYDIHQKYGEVVGSDDVLAYFESLQPRSFALS